MTEKRELPTRHNFLTEAVKRLLEPKQTTQDLWINAKSTILITSHLLDNYTYYSPPTTIQSPDLTKINDKPPPQVRLIKPITKRKHSTKEMITEDYYLKRHRRHELEEKKQKNREKECLRHGYYQQKQLVERIKTMDKSLLQSIVSSILHRNSLSLTSQQQVIDDHYLEQIHEQLLQNAVDHLARYEALGFKDHEPILVKQQQQQQQQPILSQQLESKEKKEIEKSSPTKRKEIKTFGGYRTLKSQQGNRRSSRRLIAFGQRLPLFETQEFQLPLSIIKEKKKK